MNVDFTYGLHAIGNKKALWEELGIVIGDLNTIF